MVLVTGRQFVCHVAPDLVSVVGELEWCLDPHFGINFQTIQFQLLVKPSDVLLSEDLFWYLVVQSLWCLGQSSDWS